MNPLRYLRLFTTVVGVSIWLAPSLASAQDMTETYRQIDGHELKAHLFLPDREQAGAIQEATGRPALVMIHGGGWGGGHAGFFFAHCRYFASRGLVAVSISYRLTQREGVTPIECTADAQAAIRWLRENAERFDVDPDRIAVAGDSAGGHLAAACGFVPDVNAELMDVPEDAASTQANAVIMFNPIIDTTETGWPHWRPTEQQAEARGLTVEQMRRRISPMHHVRPGLPPSLLMHGDADTTTPLSHSERFAEKMADIGNRCELVVLPDRKHAFILVGYSENDDQTIVKSMQRVDRFLGSLGYVEGEPTIEPGWTQTVEAPSYR